MRPVKFRIFFALTALFSAYNGLHCGAKNALSAQKIPQNCLDTQMSTKPSNLTKKLFCSAVSILLGKLEPLDSRKFLDNNQWYEGQRT